MGDGDRNRRIYLWAHSKVGHRVGHGKCWDLANQALQHAGARSSSTTGEDDDYDWGLPVSPAVVIPGDILQFRNHVVTTTVSTKATFEDGSSSSSEEETVQRRLHHTAIVAANHGTAGLVIFEQNAPPLGERVQRHVLLISSRGPIVRTEVRNMKDRTGKLRPARVVETTTTRVTGWVWAYALSQSNDKCRLLEWSDALGCFELAFELYPRKASKSQRFSIRVATHQTGSTSKLVLVGSTGDRVFTLRVQRGRDQEDASGIFVERRRRSSRAGSHLFSERGVYCAAR